MSADASTSRLDTISEAVAPGSAVEMELILDQQGRLVLRQAGRAEIELALAERGALLGRAADCEVRLDRPEVSRKHARLTRQDGAWSIQDLGSTHGVHLRRKGSAPERVSEVAPILSEDVVCIGGFALRFRLF
jgi:pSer/pThr/pTyr-binding forkhead associated (FHA) protein